MGVSACWRMGVHDPDIKEEFKGHSEGRPGVESSSVGLIRGLLASASSVQNSLRAKEDFGALFYNFHIYSII